ncbi:MAG TPA: polysaccharide biosynthesis tyrosine autokinase [Halomicronema sp.]
MMKDNFNLVDRASPQSQGIELAQLGKILRKRAIPAIAVGGTVFAAVAFVTVTQTPEYQSQTLILLDNKTSVPVVTAIAPETAQTAKDLSTEIQILQSQALVAKAISQLESSSSNISVGEVIKNLSIRQAGQADVLIVSYTDTVPERAKAVLDALGATYINYSLDKQRSQATNAIGFIQQQLPSAQKSLNESAEAIRTFRQKYGVVDPDSYAAQVVDLKRSLEQQKQAIEVSVSKTEQQYQELQKQMASSGQNPQTALTNTVLSEDAVYQKLAEQLKEIEAKYTLERTRFQDNHPVMQNLLQQRQSLLNLLQNRSQQVLGAAVSQVNVSEVTSAGATRQNLAQELVKIQTELASQNAQLQQLKETEKETAKRFDLIPELQQTYAELQREFKVKSEAVNNFLTKLQELQISEAQETAPWRILEKPYVPNMPVSPNVPRNLLLGLIAGGLLGVATAILLERTDQRIKDAEEAKELGNLPCLGMVPRVSMPVLITNFRESQETDGYQSLLFTEAIRSLALNLRYLGPNGEVKTLGFTSSTPGEGKSTLTYNIGRALAELGHRVLLVDADMRKPTIHQLLNKSNMFGLSTVIATDQGWRDIIYSTEGGFLDVLTSGPTPPNPVALLDSAKMSLLVQEWRQAYDYVLVDTPPVVGVTDAQTVAPKLDRMVLVAGVERATRSSLSEGIEVLERSRCNMAGMIVNFVDRQQDGYYSAYYSYYARPVVEDGESSTIVDKSRSRTKEILDNFLKRK